MCCEQDTCALAVHNEGEGLCYLKNSEAFLSGYRMRAEGMSTYTIETRQGELARYSSHFEDMPLRRNTGGAEPVRNLTQRTRQQAPAGERELVGKVVSTAVEGYWYSSMIRTLRYFSNSSSDMPGMCFPPANKVHRSRWRWRRRSAATSGALLSDFETQRI